MNQEVHKSENNNIKRRKRKETLQKVWKVTTVNFGRLRWNRLKLQVATILFLSQKHVSPDFIATDW